MVFDRIRENLRTRRREDEETIINTAINQVLSRTIVTSLTVVIVLIPLVLGGRRSAARFFAGFALAASCSGPIRLCLWRARCCCYGPERRAAS